MISLVVVRLSRAATTKKDARDGDPRAPNFAFALTRRPNISRRENDSRRLPRSARQHSAGTYCDDRLAGRAAIHAGLARLGRRAYPLQPDETPAEVSQP